MIQTSATQLLRTALEFIANRNGGQAADARHPASPSRRARAKRNRCDRQLLVLFTLLGPGALSFGAIVSAQSSGGTFTLDRSVVANGGGTSAGEGFVITGTIAQTTASTESSASGSFDLQGGFWFGAPGNPGALIFLDGFEAITPMRTWQSLTNTPFQPGE